MDYLNVNDLEAKHFGSQIKTLGGLRCATRGRRKQERRGRLVGSHLRHAGTSVDILFPVN